MPDAIRTAAYQAVEAAVPLALATSSTVLRPGDPVWDTAWTPARPAWLESVDDDGDAWVVNHPAHIEVGDGGMLWTAHVTELRLRQELTSPGDDYCCQCLEGAVLADLTRCSACGHVAHPGCMQAHQADHATFYAELSAWRGTM